MRGVQPRSAIILSLSYSLKMRRFQAATVQAGAPADTRGVPVVAEVINMLPRFKGTDSQREHQPVTQQCLTFMSDTAVPGLDSDSALPDQTTICRAYATCKDAL